MKRILQMSVKATSYSVVSLLLLILLPQYSRANCNSLTSYTDQDLCHKTASYYDIEDVELWQGNRNIMFATELKPEISKLVVVERKESGEGQEISQFADIPAGKLFLQEVDIQSEVLDLREGTLIRLKRQSDKSRTLMLVLSPRSEPDEPFGSDTNSSMSTEGSGFEPESFSSGTNSIMNTAENNSNASGINPISIVGPSAFFVIVQLLGWLGTFTHIYDVYYYDRINDGAGAAKLSTVTVVATAFCTFGLNLIPHFIIHKLRTPRAAADPV